MRWIRWVWVLAFVAHAAAARAETSGRVILVTGEAWPAEMVDSLRVEITARGLELEDVPVFSRQRLAASELARSGAAVAVIWVETDREGRGVVRVIGARSSRARSATLPGPMSEVTPRVFALIASSLADEAIHPPEVDVDLRFDVEVDGATGTARVRQPDADPPADPAPPAAPAPEAHSRAPGLSRAVTPAPLGNRGLWFVEVGGVSAPMVGGAQLGVGRYMTDTVRLHLQGMMVYVVPAEEAATYLGIALSRVAKRRGAHVGANLGYVSMPDSEGFAAGAWIGWRWPIGRRAALDARAGIQAGKIDDEPPVPVPLGTLTVELPM